MPLTKMSFLSARTGVRALATALLAVPLSAAAATLSLPDDATIGVEVVDAITLTGETSRREGILLRPADSRRASNTLPEYCVIVGDAQRDGERVRITTHDITCIETADADSLIFSGPMQASAYDSDGQYGISCENGACRLPAGHPLTLTLTDGLEIVEQANPSAEINKQRRQANGEGVANPIPAERPAPASEAADD